MAEPTEEEWRTLAETLVEIYEFGDGDGFDPTDPLSVRLALQSAWDENHPSQTEHPIIADGPGTDVLDLPRRS